MLFFLHWAWIAQKSFRSVRMPGAASAEEFLAYAVEVKRMKNIDLSVIDEMKTKLSRFPRRENVTLRKALVYDGTLSPQVEERGYFDALIPARTLMTATP